jgi:hypothetical protein
MSATYFPVACICGSMRYYGKMLELACRLTADGWIVVMPFVADYVGGAPTDSKKEMLDDMHFTKISMSEKVYIVGSHIGESTRKEINYATDIGVPIEYIATP